MKTLLAVFISFVGFVSIAQTRCKDFKTGKFQIIEKGKVTTLIERNESIQIERSGKIEVKLEIKWIDDCTYRLKLIYGNDAFWNGRPKDLPTTDVIVTITKTNEKGYSQESRSEGSDHIYRSDILRAEDL